MGRVIKITEEYTTTKTMTEGQLLDRGITQLEIEAVFKLDPNNPHDLTRFHDSRIADCIEDDGERDHFDGDVNVEFMGSN